MSGLEVNTRKLEEIYQEWRGNKSCYDNGRPVFEADELLDFAEYCLKHKANDVGTGKRQSNIPDVIKSVCERCGQSDYEQKVTDIIDYDFEK
jgi:hypothetical protein